LLREADRLAAQARRCSAILRQLDSARHRYLNGKESGVGRRHRGAAFVAQTTARLNELEQQRVAQLPDVKTRTGRYLQAGDARLCANGIRRRGLREFRRAAMRAVAA
jgi:hypothetical protein